MFGERTDIGHIWQDPSSVEVGLFSAANLSAPGGEVNGRRKSFQWCGLLDLPAPTPYPFDVYLRERRGRSTPKPANKLDDVLRFKSVLGGTKLIARAKIFRFAILDYLSILLPQNN